MTQVRLIDANEREQLAPLLNKQSASDALAAYCALLHPMEKVKLYVSYDGGGRPNSFLAMAQTGMDLFRPLAVPFVASPKNLRDLLDAALSPGHPVLLSLPLEQRDWLDQSLLLSEMEITELLRLDPTSFKPIVNVLVMEVNMPSGLPRFEIRTRSGSYAAAGINWMGDRFSEIYLEADREAQIRGLGLSVISAMSTRLLEENRISLFGLDSTTELEFKDLSDIGYRSTGTRRILAQGIQKPRK
ncbi:MAG: hypothetical protein A2Z14_15390 [Chloroflexi bacterium RBG_16_48_8]|nr:MAG: hypothetical protein A2Z14_15390 [Chloroflexi bacterium RBG_16_48_8]